jgi:hypothetical protein
MASSASTKKDNGKRPSRLLNLNNSPPGQKELQVRNATISPLLSKIPPEIRSRIYDYVFGDLIVRVNHGGRHSRGVFQPDGKSGHQQITCNTWRACEKQWRQRRSSDRVSIDTSSWIFGVPSANPNYVPCDLNKPYEIPVQLLQVCRQIYHEAVLKPFTEPTFKFMMTDDGVNRGMTSFLDSLVPTQARAIQRLHLTCSQAFDMTKNATSLFKGVQHVEIEISTRNDAHQVIPLQDLELFKQKGGIEWLKKAGLKSVRFEVTLFPGDDPTHELRNSIMEWIEREENEIVPAVASKKRKRD